LKKTNVSKITLGTVQFGKNYGISNKLGKPNSKTINEILNYSIKNGINTFDTAAGYGESEHILGEFLKFKEKNFSPNIITKISRISPNDENEEGTFRRMKQSVIDSKKKLNNEKITSYLLHNPEDMNDKKIIKSMIRLKEENMVENIGVSTYDENDVKKFLEIPEFDIIELPINLFDLRLVNSKLIEEIDHERKIIFARSIFLQGLFFLKPNELPLELKFAKKYLNELYEISNEYRISIAELAITFVRDIEEITSLIVGVNNVEQIKMNLELINSKKMNENIKEIILKKFSNVPDEIINPRKWKK
tara:strand:- start:33 stop:947 length:915 start_codon:yes stop_codon:yes gene_type:complete